MVSVYDLQKRYGRVDALSGLTFSVNEGEIYGIIGPDGAGKTSLFRILATLLLPDGGRVVVDGLDVVRDYRELRRRIGYMPGRFSLYQDLSVEENLQFFASVFGTTVERNYGLVKDIYSQLEPFKARRAGTERRAARTVCEPQARGCVRLGAAVVRAGGVSRALVDCERTRPFSPDSAPESAGGLFACLAASRFGRTLRACGDVLGARLRGIFDFVYACAGLRFSVSCAAARRAGRVARF